MNQNELLHYGVVGMKWGVRKDPYKAYSKAVNKRNKLTQKAEKAKTEYTKAIIKSNSGVSSKYKKLQLKADKYQLKAEKKKYGLFTDEEKAALLQQKADEFQKKS